MLLLIYRLMTPFFKKKTNLIALTVLVAGLALVIAISQSGNDDAEFIRVIRGTVAEEVSLTGRVTSLEDVSLAFEKSGRVVQIYHRIGDRVTPGTLLVALDNQDLSAQRLEAEANVKVERAKLDEMKRGIRKEELQIKETAVKQAEQKLANTYAGIIPVLGDAYINADDAIRKQIDALIDRDEEVDPKLVFNTSDSRAQIEAEAGRYASRNELNTWRKELDALYVSSTPESLDLALARAKAHLIALGSFLNRLSDAVQAAQQVPADTLATYKASVNAARTKIATAVTNVANVLDGVSNDKLSLEQAQNDLVLAQAGSTPEAIQAQEAKVEQAEAKVAQIIVQLQKSALRSPISGIVTKIEAEEGEIVAPNVAVVSLISDSKFQIEANVPEADIGKVSLSDAVRITLDAFPGETFSGKVAIIEPAETIIDGAVNFKINVVFDATDERIKSGFTANLDIRTDARENVLVLPQFAIIQNGERTFVRKNTKDGTREVPVRLGLRGSDGTVEIISGVSEGEEVLRTGTEK